MIKALSAFNAANGCFPKQIVILRDGVGDSSKRMIIDSELCQIQKALESNPQTKDTKVILIMVNKKIKNKLISEAGNRIANPKPGCLVDHTITGENGSYDFFIVNTESR